MPPLARYILRRLALAVVTVAGVVVFVFILTHMIPADPARLRAGPLADQALVDKYKQIMGLDQPLYVQFGRYVGQLLHGDLGSSWRTGQPVLKELADRLPATAELALTALLLALVVGIGLGIAAATWPGGLLDQGVRIFATLGASQALFWLALVNVHVFYYVLRLAPAPMDRLSVGLQAPAFVTGLYTMDSLVAGNAKAFVDAVRHLALPAITLAFVVSAPVIKMTRAAMMDTLHSDFIRTARAIGVPAREVILADGLRNAFIPILTMLGIVFGYLIAGNVVVEKVFAWSGIGQYAWNALITADFDAMQGFVLMIAVIYITLNLLIDLAYGFINPRIRLG